MQFIQIAKRCNTFAAHSVALVNAMAETKTCNSELTTYNKTKACEDIAL